MADVIQKLSYSYSIPQARQNLGGYLRAELRPQIRASLLPLIAPSAVCGFAWFALVDYLKGDGLSRSLGIPSPELHPLLANILGLVVLFPVFRWLTRLLSGRLNNMVNARLLELFPDEPTTLERSETTLTWITPRLRIELEMAGIFLIQRNDTGLIIGVRSMAFFVPAEAFPHTNELRSFLRAVANRMTPEAHRRSAAALTGV